MKKSLIILLVLGVLLTLGLASCKNEVQTPADELVSVSFEQAVSRALTATLQEFKKENYYWYYAAKKADSTGLISGQTAGYDYSHAVAVKSGKGLDGQVPGFSQGSWDFLLFAYEEDPEATGATITKAEYTYWGEATAVTLKKRVNPQPTDNMVTVTVSPATTGKGTLFVDMEHIKLSEASSASHNAVAPLVSISCGEKTYEIEAGSNIKYKVDAGQWTVKVEYTDGDIIFATGTVIATVYPRLTTIVTGDVSELITYAQFDAKENPDLVKVTASSAATTYAGITEDVDLSGTVKEGTVVVKTVETSVAAADAQKIMAEMATNAGVELDSNTTMSLALNVDPTAATETSITYDISMSATLSVTQGSETKSTVKDVDKLDNVVIVEISMQKNLQDVAVTHSGEGMQEGTSATTLTDGQYYYDGAIGELYICTSSFSPFAISYKLLEYAASLNGVKYETLAAAIAAASETKAQTVYLLRNVSEDDIDINKSLILDLCGFTATVNLSAWDGEVDIKSGKIIGRVDAYDSSVLTIEADVAITGQVVVWGDGVFGEAGCKTPVLNFYGKATNTGDSALSTNGTDKSGAAINIYEGAEITSTDDIAVYLPSGNTTIYGGKITGATAVYFKSGTLTVKDGEFVGNLSPADYEYYGNGANATGDALVIDSCGYPNGAPVAVINGGKFTGTKAAIGYYRYKESEEAKISVDGGKFNTDPSEFLAPGYIAVKGSDDYYTLEYDKDLVEAAQAKGLTVLKTGVETRADGYSTPTLDNDSSWDRVGVRFADGTIGKGGVIFRYYKDGKFYIKDATDSSGSYTISGDVNGIIDGAFTKSSVTSVSFTGNLDYAKNAFADNTTVASIDWGGMTVVPYRLFAKAKGLVSDITLPSTIREVGRYAFQQTNITSVKANGIAGHESVLRIGDGAFAYNPELVSIRIEDDVYLGTQGNPNNTYVARGCPKLTDVYFTEENMTIGFRKTDLYFCHFDDDSTNLGSGITFHCDSYIEGELKKYCTEISNSTFVRN